MLLFPISMICFGLDLDGPMLLPLQKEAGVHYAGPRKLLRLLEQKLGLGGYPEKTDYLRIEMYRQALLQHLATDAGAFYNRSFDADRFATATVLLEHRDALQLAGWDFEPNAVLPGRLGTFAAVEKLFRLKAADPANAAYMVGEADRWVMILDALQHRPVDIAAMVIYEPFSYQPTHIQRLIAILQRKDIAVTEIKTTPQAVHPDGMLGRFQRYLTGEKIEKSAPTGISEIAILHARNESDAATFLAQTLALNPGWRPAFMLPDLRQNLELALAYEGLPAFGVLSATLARPALQVLKLAPAFIWEPIDIFKIMEFVTLPVKPLDRGLALEIARVLAEKPGMFSDLWYGAVLGYLEAETTGKDVREQYNFWFDRRRYRSDTAAPKRDVIELYTYLQEWAFNYEQSGNKDSSLPVLGEQARRIRELLETLPEQRITFLELERIVRTIVEPAPTQFAETSAGHYPFFHQPGAALAPVREMIWWNCLFENDVPPSDFWQPEERAWLASNHTAPEHPRLLAQRRLLTRARPVLQTQERLLLFVPEQSGGMPSVHSLLIADLGALFGDLQSCTFHINQPEDRQRLSQWLQLPGIDLIPANSGSIHRPHIRVDWQEAAEQRHETPTGLENLFYYPHRWYLRQQVGLYPSNLLTVARDNRLLGNLAHRFFEFLLKEDFSAFDKKQVGVWIDDRSDDLLRKEGATLLLYGREPERKTFLNKVKNAAWNLISLLRSNDWEVAATELPLEGMFSGAPVRGKADLVLKRGNEQAIVDLKWSGATKRKELIQNEEDLQLVLYAHLLESPGQWPHTAYFILESGKMIARNPAAFKEAIIAGKGQDNHAEVCDRILAKMQKTYTWRIEQLQKGMLEIRTERTASALDNLYAEALTELLEMKREDARWDDYGTLIDFM